MSAGAVARPELIEVDASVADVIAGEVTASPASGPGITLAAAVLGFFAITLDAVVVNVAPPSISRDFSAGITGLQWVVDRYTVMFAALLLWSARWPIGALLSAQEGLMHGLRLSLLIAVAACAASLLLRPASSTTQKGQSNVRRD